MINDYTIKIIDLLAEEFPEIKELKFGCVIYDNGKWLFNIIWNTTWFYPNWDLIMSTWYDHSSIRKWEYKIIWSYHIGHLLRWLNKKCDIWNTFYSKKEIEVVCNWNTHLHIDTTKQPMDFSEAESKELYLFMKTVLDTNNK